MRKKRTRALAGLLTIALLLGFVPAPNAAAAPEPEDEAQELTYLFTKGNANQNVSEVTSFEMTTEGGDGELLPGLKSAPWRFESQADDAIWCIYNPGANGYGTLLSASAGKSLRIQVPAGGRYAAYTNNWFWTEGGKLSVYLRSAQEDETQNQL